ncbi:MAG TPA: glycosyltransferase [Acidimicrobiales bacterium]|nr:glycosyltransferase [Acidimicrobiales bacterium]
MIPSIVERDAVSSHTVEAQRVLRSMGYVSEIFACTWGPEMEGRVRPIADIPREGGGGQWICYQGSIGSPAAQVVADHPAPKMVDYHNITPTEYVERWMPALGEEVRLGRRQLAELAPLVDFAVADSAFNCTELDAWGYRTTRVSALMMDLSAFECPPDRGLAAAIAGAKNEGGADWLFVGQMLPHKAHQDVVKAFDCYLKLYDPKARLHLIGRPSCGEYALALRRFVERLGIGASVNLAGSVSAAELSAYYRAADVLVCCSDHEGFCAPLLEAMHHGIPVVAYGAAAVGETVLDAGIVLPTKEPVRVATAAREVLSDRELRETLIDRGRRRSAAFTLEAARQAFRENIELAVGAWGT